MIIVLTVLLLIIIFILYVIKLYKDKFVNYNKIELYNNKFNNNNNLHIIQCCFFKDNYYKEAILSIKSIRNNGKFNGKISLICDKLVINHASIFHDLNVNIKIVDDCKNIASSSGYRLKMIDTLNLQYNENILYLDTDIMILKPIILPKLNNKVNGYGPSNTTQNTKSYAGLLTKDHNILKMPALNAGILYFNPNNKIHTCFKNAWNNLQKNIKKVTDVWEQPYLNLELCKNNLYTLSLNDIVFEERWIKEKNMLCKDNYIFNHFCGLRGDTRKIKMEKYL